MKSLINALENKILVLDGAMGTMIQKYNLNEKDYRGERFKNFKNPLKGNNDLLSITQSKIISEIHKKYLDAGADIIQTNTFSSTSVSMADYKMENLVYELNFESAKIAKKLTQQYTQKNKNKPRFVAGSIGPTNKTASISPDVNDPGFRSITFDELVSSYSEQIKGLIEGGVDVLLVETIFDTLNAKAALFAIDTYLNKNNLEIPIMVSGTITDQSGRTLSGQTVKAFLYSLSHMPLLSIGFNCALGAEQLIPYMKTLSENTSFYTSAHPNAGLPNAFGEYDQTPSEMSSQIKNYLDDNLVNIIGGCCGTDEKFIKEIYELTKNYSPRKIKNV
tara:strand:- start:3707 stop:4705 length:999 start_codon:yes stop_codon:yes gene_type:complete